MKRFCRVTTLFVFVTLALNTAAGATAGTDVVDRIVAVVNEDIILLSELNSRMAPYVQRIHAQGFDAEKERKTLFSVRTDVLNRMIDEKLTDQEIQRNDIKIDDADIDATIERIKSANSFTDEDLRGFLEREGMTMAAYRDKIREQVLRSRLVNYEVKSKIVITEEEIRDYYDKHPELYAGTRRYHLRNILIRAPYGASDAERESVAQTMESIRTQFAEGKDFAELARTYSQSPTAENGGDLGEFDRDTLSPQIQAALEGIGSGQITPVLDTDQGFQLFFVEAVSHSDGKSLESVRDEIHQKLYNDVVDKKFLSWLGELRSRSHIKVIN